ncbi:MAG TPA: NUDIX domain-containing protein [Acidimicrobiales bacterium]
MPLSPYVAGLRRAVGSDLLLLPAVSVLPRDAVGRVLLVRQADDGRWGLVGGSIEVGEAPDEAAVREAREEAGVDVLLTRIATAVGGPRFQVEYPNGDRVAYVSVVYEARVVAGTPRPDGDETTAVGWFTPGELARLPVNPFGRAVLADLGLPAGGG